MISEQVKQLRDYASGRKGEIADICNEAAATIEELCAKVHAANMERSSAHYHNGWIPVDERLPELDDDNYVITNGHYISKPMLITILSVFDGKPIISSDFAHYCDDGNWYWNVDDDACDFELVEVTVTAWKPLPEPYKAE